MKKPLIIIGKQGAGKTTVARKLGAKSGSFYEKTMTEITQPFGLSFLYDTDYKTVIVEECDVRSASFNFINTIADSEHILINAKLRECRKIKTPHFVFIFQTDVLPTIGMDFRRFDLLNINLNER